MHPPVKRNLPDFRLAQVKAIAKDLYEVDGNFRALTSERDLTWTISNETGPLGVLKISNAREQEGVIDFQIKAIGHILEYSPDTKVPQVIPTKKGTPYEWVTCEATGEPHMVRMLTYLHGNTVETTPQAYCDEYYQNVGIFVGRMDVALQGFFHPFARSNEHLWDISRCLQLRNMLAELPTGQLKPLVRDILDEAEAETLSKLKRTRNQVVHQDAHDGNVLVSSDEPCKVVAVLDFGDMCYNSILAEIVAAAEAYSDDEEDPIRPLIHVARGYDFVNPLTEQEVDLLFDALRLRLAVASTVVNHRAVHDTAKCVHIEDRHFSRMLFKLVDMGRETVIRRVRQALRFPVYSSADNDGPAFRDRREELETRRAKYLGNIWHFYKRPLNITRAQGAWMYTADGTAYLDAYNNVPQMGHSHPHIVKAIARQAKALNTNTRYLCDIVADYAERLTKDLPDHLDTCIFVNSGSEANDIAIQIAQSLTGNNGGLVIDNAYHGCTQLTMQYSPESWVHLPKERHPDQIERLLEPDTYNGPYSGESQAAEKYAADADRALRDLAERGYRAAAFIVDTSMCAHGLITTPSGYFDLVAQKARTAGALVIADEVQAGMGRMGEFWGFMAAGMDPGNVDIVTMGKPVANGHPLGVVILSNRMMKEVLDGTHAPIFSTFGGNTVACAAGMAALDVIEQERLIEKGSLLGDYLRGELSRLAGRHSLVGDVRGRGMLTGLEFVTSRETRTTAVVETEAIVEEMLNQRVMVGTGTPGVLKLRPSFAWDREEVDFFITALDRSLQSIR